MHALPLLWLSVAVFVAGFIDSIAGGGGLITLPAYLIAGVSPTLALGTNKLVSSVGTTVATIKYIMHRRMPWAVIWVGIPCALAGSAMGAHMISLLDQNVVRRAILFVLPVAALLTLLPKPKNHKEVLPHWKSPRFWLVVPLVAGVVGWYDGFLGPGTGSLMMLALYGLAQLSLLHSAASARLLNLCSNVGALVAFIFHGQVLFHLALPLCAAGIAGNYLGSSLAIKRGSGIVRLMLILSCALLFGYLLWRQFFGNI